MTDQTPESATPTTPANPADDNPRKKAWRTRRAKAAAQPETTKPAAPKRARAPKTTKPESSAAEVYRQRLELRLGVVEALEQLAPGERAEVFAAFGVKP